MVISQHETKFQVQSYAEQDLKYIKHAIDWLWHVRNLPPAKESLEAENIQDLFKPWGWEYADGTLTKTYPGLGQEFYFFDALAPFVVKNSYITLSDEQGARWRWVFTPRGVDQKYGRWVYK